MFRRALALANYAINQRPFYVEPRGSQSYREAHKAEFHEIIRRSEALVKTLPLPPGRETTGASATDYYLLHRYVTELRPRRILEFGTGMTTLVMAAAMREIGTGHVVTVDHIDKFSKETQADLPAECRPFVDFVVTYTEPDDFDGTTGLHYHDYPVGDFDLLYVDGPSLLIIGRAQFPGTDIFRAALQNGRSLDIITDRRLQTLNFFSMYTDHEVAFDPCFGVGSIRQIRPDEVSKRHLHRRPMVKVRSSLDVFGIN